MTENTENHNKTPEFTEESLYELYQAVRRWAVLTQFEQYQENYEQLRKRTN